MKIRMSTRLVLVFNKVVIKIPLSCRGYLQGKNEKYLYEKYKGKGLLGELISERFGVVIMKTYPLASRIPEYVVYGIKKEVPELNIPNCDLHNVKNWGKDEHCNPILIDYGINQYISTLY